MVTEAGEYCRPEASILWDFDRLIEDAQTRELIRLGLTMGCFYIESPAMRSLFQRMRCTSYEEVVAASSVIRPGVSESGMMHTYIERHTGRAETEYVHPELADILGQTHGVMIYQEDVIRVAHLLGGLTLGEADLLRRAMSGKLRSPEAMERLTEKFIRSCRRRGIDEESIAEIWRQIESFAGYGFCKGHSAAFAVLSYQTAWLKAHCPGEFMASVLNNEGGFYGPAAYVSEARRMGLRLRPPDINASEVAYTGCTLRQPNVANYHMPFAEAEKRPPLGWVRVGLGAIKNMETETVQNIVGKRAKKPYANLEDFLQRSSAGRETADRLIRAGAFDSFGLMRPEQLLRLDAWFQRRENVDDATPSLF